MNGLTHSRENEKLVELYSQKISDYDKKIQQYEKDKADISDTAKKYEAERDQYKKHSSAFGIAVIFLQVSILLSSIAALTRKKFVWYFSLLVGFAGILFFINGFFLLI